MISNMRVFLKRMKIQDHVQIDVNIHIKNQILTKLLYLLKYLSIKYNHINHHTLNNIENSELL